MWRIWRALLRATPVADNHTTTEAIASRGWTDHAVERAWQRHGNRYDAADWRVLLLDILAARAGQSSPAILVGIDPHHPARMIYRATLAGIIVRAVYDSDTCTVITIMDKSALISRKRGHARVGQNVTGRTRRERRAAMGDDDG